jgi:uncharacterized membrane protein YbhN (UPF0104 family)
MGTIMNDVDMAEPYRTIHRKYLVSGTLIFVLITALTFVVLFIMNDAGRLLDMLAGIRPEYLFAIAALMASDACLDTARYYVLAKKLAPSLSFRVMFQANMADSFGGAITPFQVGGGPAMLFIMRRGGIAMADALSAMAATFGMTLLFLLCAGLVSVLLVTDRFSNAALGYMMRYSIIAFCLALGVLGLSYFIPQWLEK